MENDCEGLTKEMEILKSSDTESKMKLDDVKEEEGSFITHRGKLNLRNPFREKVKTGGVEVSNHSWQLFQKGGNVNVRLEENGLAGSWHKAKVCGVKPGLRQVEFDDIEDENTGRKAREWVQLGTQIPPGKLPKDARLITDGKSLLRPAGPGMPPDEPCFRNCGGWPRLLWVEVLDSNTWWEGVLNEDASPEMIDHPSGVIVVKYPLLHALAERVQLQNVRVLKDWNQETGQWTIRGRYLVGESNTL